MTTSAKSYNRSRWIDEMMILATDKKMPNLAVELIRLEWASLGRGRGWRESGQWFNENWYLIGADNVATFNNMQWLAIQSLIWFAREA